MSLRKKWSDITKQERIHILKAFGMSHKEANEIYADNFDKLPTEIRAYGGGNLDISAKDWLKELFECENCAECHRGWKSHTAIPFNGNWFASCNPKKKT